MLENRKTVLIVKSALEEFRVPFYTTLASGLQTDNIDLRVLVPANALASQELVKEGSSSKLFVATDALRFNLGARRLKYQRIGRSLDTADLVIVQQSSSDLTNYLLFATRRSKGYRLAFWGHGQNFQKSLRSRTGECLKRCLSKRVDYWFAYNDLSSEVVQKLPFPGERICVVNNSIDTESSRADWNSITCQESTALRQTLGISEAEPVVVYCGSLYKAKKLKFLLESVADVRRTLPLHLIVIGGGEGQGFVQQFAHQNAQWVHYVGARYGREKATYFRLAKLCLLPGAVGLAIVDALAYETPLLTTRSEDHGPEISYLEQGENGWITDCSIEDYASAITRLLTDTDTRSRLVEGCRRTASRITLGNMVARFRSGVVSAVTMPPRRSFSKHS